jgi:hypothetical protein
MPSLADREHRAVDRRKRCPQLVGDRGDEVAPHLLQAPLLRQVAERVDRASREPDARDREPERASLELDRQRRRPRPFLVDLDEVTRFGPARDRVRSPPTANRTGGEPGDRLGRGIPEDNHAGVVDEEDAFPKMRKNTGGLFALLSEQAAAREPRREDVNEQREREEREQAGE